MSSQPPPIFSNSATLYRYVVVAALSTVVFIGLLLFWRSRIIERRLALLGPIQGTTQNALPEKPLLHDVYLDSRGESWHEMMPLSIHRVGSWPLDSAKHTSLDIQPLISAQLIIALMMAMPCPDPMSRPPESSQDIEQALPYLEFGVVVDVDVPGGILSPS
ncbi:hypothetical protein B0H19DRAFT_1372444 [Mycena capillaripes]|nr:hypothetical protein B0H19DRAFT_1372444 [Mycena capillaripes]